MSAAERHQIETLLNMTGMSLKGIPDYGECSPEDINAALKAVDDWVGHPVCGQITAYAEFVWHQRLVIYRLQTALTKTLQALREATLRDLEEMKSYTEGGRTDEQGTNTEKGG